MNKIAILSVILFFTNSVNADMIVPRLSLNFPGTYELDALEASDVGTQLSGAVGVEYLHQDSDHITVGVGAQYTLDTKLNSVASAFNLQSVYLTIIYTLVRDLGGVAPYIKVNAGCNTLLSRSDDRKIDGDVKGSAYWAAGIGTKFLNNFYTDVMYSSNISISGDIKYSTISLNMGYGFGI
jgi:hypothetical protein